MATLQGPSDFVGSAAGGCMLIPLTGGWKRGNGPVGRLVHPYFSFLPSCFLSGTDQGKREHLD